MKHNRLTRIYMEGGGNGSCLMIGNGHIYATKLRKRRYGNSDFFLICFFIECFQGFAEAEGDLLLECRAELIVTSDPKAFRE